MGFRFKDRGGWAVRFSEVAATNLTRAEENDAGHAGFTPCALHFARKWSVPQDPNSRCGTGLSARENDAFGELSDAVASDSPVVATGHRLLGYPWPVQGDRMEEECQLASGGVYCGGSGSVDQALVDRLRPGADRWRLLLQVDSDDNADMMWGDCGMLYFWIPRESLIARRFEDVWVVLQCS